MTRRGRGSESTVVVDCEIRYDKPWKDAIAIVDGTMESVTIDGLTQKKEKWFWLPRSLTEVAPDGKSVEIPEWLALDKGLI